MILLEQNGDENSPNLRCCQLDRTPDRQKNHRKGVTQKTLDFLRLQDFLALIFLGGKRDRNKKRSIQVVLNHIVLKTSETHSRKIKTNM